MPTRHAYTLEPGRPTPGRANLLRPPIALQAGAGILTRFPSATTLVLALGADSPCADARGAGNLGLTATGPFTLFIATHVSIRTSDTSSRVHTPPSQAYGTLSYHPSAPFNTPIHKSHHRPRCSRSAAHRSLAFRVFTSRHNAGTPSTRSSGALESAASVHSLSPVTSSAQDDSTSELLRFL